MNRIDAARQHQPTKSDRPVSKTGSADSAFKTWKSNPTDASMMELRKQLEPTVRSAMMSFAGNNNAYRLKADLLVSDAVRTFDSSKASLPTHVFNTLRRLQRLRGQSRTTVHVPEGKQLDAQHIRRYMDAYQDDHGYEPSVLQVADELSLPRRRVLSALSVLREVPESSMTGETGDLFGGTTSSALWRDFVYHDLDERNRKVFEWSTGYGGVKRLPKTEIARRLNISPAAVSQRVGTITKRLQEAETAAAVA